jgi:aconitate hydratase
MTRGTFANIRLKNILTPGFEGGVTKYFPNEEIINIYEAAMRYKMSQTPVIVIAGSDYGMGSSRDWAAKGAFLLGIKAVIADSFERIHRSNLLGMGVLPLQFKKNQTARDLGLTGRELYTILIDDDIKPGQDIAVEIRDENGIKKMVIVRSRLDTHIEVQYYKNGGILQTVLRNFLNEQKG